VVVGEAESGGDAVALVARTGADVVVMDLDMADGDGATATRALAREAPSARVLILTMHAEQERLLGLLRDGARGYLAKDAAQRELLDAIRVVASGDVYVRPSVARMLAAAIASPRRSPSHAASRYESLSERERTVLRLVAEGSTGRRSASASGSPPRPSTPTSSASRTSSGSRTGATTCASRSRPGCSGSRPKASARRDRRRPPRPRRGS
jgi:DNA-binding NarL/FixJ family response regulator